MKAGLRAALALALCLAAEVALGKLLPGARRYFDLMFLPIAWYGLKGAPRSAMFAGAAGGLLQDGWFEPSLFGVSGFNKTLLGYVLGVLGTRFDLNRGWARLTAGFLLPSADALLEVGLRRLFDQRVLPVGPLDLLLEGIATGLLCWSALAILDRRGAAKRGAAAARRGA